MILIDGSILQPNYLKIKFSIAQNRWRHLVVAILRFLFWLFILTEWFSRKKLIFLKYLGRKKSKRLWAINFHWDRLDYIEMKTQDFACARLNSNIYNSSFALGYRLSCVTISFLKLRFWGVSLPSCPDTVGINLKKKKKSERLRLNYTDGYVVRVI